MTCATPNASASAPAASAQGAWANAVKIPFFMPDPIGSGLVTFTITPALSTGGGGGGGIHWRLMNAAGLLQSGNPLQSRQTGAWSLGSSPHQLWIATDALLVSPHSSVPIPQACAYTLVGACTTLQTSPSCPTCPPGKTCSAATGYQCVAAAPSCPATCPAGKYCNAATGFKCVACSPACAAGGICGPTANACTCPPGKCCPPCPSGQTCSNNSCHAAGGGPPPPPPTSSNSGVLLLGAAVVGGIVLIHRSPQAAATRSGAARRRYR